MQGRIKVGAGIFQDHHFDKWPNCLPPKRHNGLVNQDMIFDIEWRETGKDAGYWNCKADGYGYIATRGEIGDYGNGSIFVRDKNGVEVVTANETR